jgi:hypothetical protein
VYVSLTAGESARIGDLDQLVDAESGILSEVADRPGDLCAFQAAGHAVGSLGRPHCG